MQCVIDCGCMGKIETHKAEARGNFMSEIESPCMKVCRINPETQYCIGCWRTIDEIVRWKEAGDSARLEIIERVHDRHEAAGGDSFRYG